MSMQPEAGPSRLKTAIPRKASKDDLDIKKSSFKFRQSETASRSAPVATSKAAHNPIIERPPSPLLDKGKSRAGFVATKKQTESVPDSFLRRLAGPSTNKAGLTRDPEEVRRIIYEASKGSKFSDNERKKDAATTAQIEGMLAALNERIANKRGDLSLEEAEMDKLFDRLEREHDRHLDQTVVVIDCDAFYASVEELDNPSLKGKAFGVGSGVLTTASYEARKYGCRSAMAGFVAKKLCPHLIFVKPDFAKYSAASKKVMDVLKDYDANLAPASLDEAYMNITEHLQKTGQTPTEAVTEMRARVKQETGLTVSAGVGPNKIVAKIAADINKPDGQCVVEPTREAVLQFMHPKSVRKIPGIGRVTERWLEAIGIINIQDIYTERGKLSCSKNNMKEEGSLVFLATSYLGLGSAQVEPGKRESRKSVGCETTFVPTSTISVIHETLKGIADDLEGDLKRTQFSGKTITLTFKLDTYERFTRALTVPNHISASADLFRVGKELLEKEIADRSGSICLRLIGLRATKLQDESPEALAKRSVPVWAQKTELPKKSTSMQPKVERKRRLGSVEKQPTESLCKRPKVAEPHANSIISSSECPLCQTRFENTKLAKINSHIERCLDDRPVKAKKAQETRPLNAFTTLMKASSKKAKAK